jgi:hypothetical protein
MDAPTSGFPVCASVTFPFNEPLAKAAAVIQPKKNIVNTTDFIYFYFLPLCCKYREAFDFYIIVANIF